ncbi:MAG: TetR/AcrR family transcriptional regulator [Thermoleophilia bacterium]|nr:TetR/AcrR family transcriptional regulator [Thermoleophilia bacterium]
MAAPAPAPAPARERILHSARSLFAARGLRAVGVDTLIADSGVAKATFYKHFPAKDDLILAYLDAEDADLSSVFARAADSAAAPADRLAAVADALSGIASAPGYRGDAFLNAAVEMPPGTRVHDRVLQQRAARRAWLAGLAEEAGAPDPQALADDLTVLIDGALAPGVVAAGDPGPAARAAAQARRVVKRALKESRGKGARKKK